MKIFIWYKESCCKTARKDINNKYSHIHCKISFMLLVLSATPHLLFLLFHLLSPSNFYTAPLSSHFHPSNQILVSLLCAFEEEGGAAIVIRPLIIENNSRKKSANLVEFDSHHIGSICCNIIYGQIRSFGCDP